jgi:hypothetical protein
MVPLHDLKGLTSREAGEKERSNIGAAETFLEALL